MRKSSLPVLSPADRRRLRALERRYERLRRTLARIGFLAIGTISELRLTCGNPTCRCHDDPRNRHGPYVYWTTKVKGKTVSRLLKPEEAQLYKAWVANRKTLDRTVKHMLEVSRDVAAVVLKGENPFVPGR